MQINKKMNLVVTVETDNGNVYVHSRPLMKEVYKENFLALSKTYAAIFGQGLSIIAGPRSAYYMLEAICKQSEVWEGERGVKNTLVREIIRNSTAILPIEGKGWEEMPLEVAIERGHIDDDEVLGELVFFMCVSAVNKRSQIAEVMTEASSIWGNAYTSQTSTEWIKSLPTLTKEESTGESQTTSSVPS